MKHNRKQIIMTLLVIITMITLPIQSCSSTTENPQNPKTIPITVVHRGDHTITQTEMDFDAFISLFNPIRTINENTATVQLQSMLDTLEEQQIISHEEKTMMNQKIQQGTLLSSIRHAGMTGLLFDLLNIFNGFGFAIKGEQTVSLIELPIARFPFLNTNITALFSGFSAFKGNGFVFTLGTNGFRYIYNYDKNSYAFPYFSSIKGSFIGYTGIILEATVSDTFGETYEGTYIIGIGMNVFTLWSET